MTSDEQKSKLVQELFEEHGKLRDQIGDSFTKMRIDNIKQIRDLVKNFILISSAIVGFSLPVFGRVDLIKSSIFLIGGLGEFLIVILYGFYYLKIVLEVENNRLATQHKEFIEVLDELQKNIIIFAGSNQTEVDMRRKIEADKRAFEKLSKEEPPKNEQKRVLDIIFSAFFVGLFLILLSMVIKI